MKTFGLYNFETIDSINEKGRLLLSFKKVNYLTIIGDRSHDKFQINWRD